MARKMVTIDGNTAAATVAHATNEVIAIYPITPSSTMGESADEFSAEGRKNIWGTVPTVVEMQSEAGASGAVHGALTTGALTTTFTASQGLLLMIPNMYKIAGELCSTVFHIAARAIATHALSIFGDHSDVMGCRSTGWAMLCSNNAQEIMDQALIAQAATLESRVPFLHFFDGFRAYMEIQKIEQLSEEDMRALVTDELVAAHRARALNPEKPTIKGTSQNPDVYFAGREAVNTYYAAAPEIVQKAMDKFAKVVGRQYHLFDYVGAPDAERLIVMMGNGAETAEEVAQHLISKGEKVGVLKVRLFRPFSLEHFAQALPKSVKAIAVLDRTKEPGSLGEPLYEDVRTAIGEAMSTGLYAVEGVPRRRRRPLRPGLLRVHRRHGQGGLRPAEGEVAEEPLHRRHQRRRDAHQHPVRSVLLLGACGRAPRHVLRAGSGRHHRREQELDQDHRQGHGQLRPGLLRAGLQEVRLHHRLPPALRQEAHQEHVPHLQGQLPGLPQVQLPAKSDMLSQADDGAVFLLNSPFTKDEVWGKIPVEVQKQIIDKKLRFYVINATKLADEVGLRGRINVTMQTAFFLISGVLQEAKALELIKLAIEDTYGNKGRDVVEMNMKAVEAARSRIEKVDYPAQACRHPAHAAARSRPGARVRAGGHRGDHRRAGRDPPRVQAAGGRHVAHGHHEMGEAQHRGGDPGLGLRDVHPVRGLLAGPARMRVIRMKVYDPAALSKAPTAFKSVDASGSEFKGMKFTLQVSALDCTGCGVCVSICPAFKKVNGEKTDKKAINMSPQLPLRDQEAKNLEFFLSLPGGGPEARQAEHAQGLAVHQAAVRVLRRLRRLR